MSHNALSQEEVDSLLSSLITEEVDAQRNLIQEIHEAILDSGRLQLSEWISLRKKLQEIEELIPHIDLLIKLKSKQEMQNG